MSKTKDFLILSHRKAQEKIEKAVAVKNARKSGSIEDIEARNERLIMRKFFDEAWEDIDKSRAAEQFVKDWIKGKI